MAKQITSFLITAALLCLLLAFPARVLSVGVCYGRLGNNLPPASDVISLYKTNNIGSMRLYDPNQDALQALQGSNISVLLDLPNELLQPFASDTNAANAWIQSNIIAFSDIDFRYIAVGNEVVPGPLSQFVLPAMTNIQNALSSAGLQNKIKVTTSVSQAVLGVSYPPSAGAFSSASQPFMGPILQFFANNGAPLLVNVYPYFAYAGDPANIRLDYALFTASEPVVIDVQFNYSNMFDAIVDSVYYAIENIDGHEVGIVVSETGWPSAGGTATTIDNAQTYIAKLIEHVGQGTPKRPGSLETYIFAMFNENQKPAGVEQHWGLFYPQKMPVFPIIFPK